MLQSSVELYTSTEGDCNMGNKDYGSSKNSTNIGKTETEKLVDGGPKSTTLNFDDHMKKIFEIPESPCFLNTEQAHDGCVSDADIDECQIIDVVPASLVKSRESASKILNWVSGIAVDPSDPVVGSMPERSCWNSYGNEVLWKQALHLRKKLFLKRRIESDSEQSSWQKTHRMHPCMYEDNVGPNYNLRDRLQCVRKPLPSIVSPKPPSASRSHSCSSVNGSSDSDTSKKSFFEHTPDKCIPMGPRFQADVPEWNGAEPPSDSKWLGTKVWPLTTAIKGFIIEREPIGKGRQDSCGCQVPKSVECVRFHCLERKIRMKRELGAAYELWGFDKMGEEVHLHWTKDEEKRFKDIVRSNPTSHNKSFWDAFVKCFPWRKRVDLVSYYYNVFLLQRRAHQNRYTPKEINSDDDESEYEPVGKGGGNEGSSSPNVLVKKQRKN